MGFIRVLLVFLVILVVVHLILRLVLRLRERGRLADEWEAGPRDTERGDYVAAGMAQYDHSLRKRLLWLTIVAPMAALALLLYLVNKS